MNDPAPTWINDRPHYLALASLVLEGAAFANHVVSRAADELYRTTKYRHRTFASAIDAGTPDADEVVADPDAFRAAVEAIYLHLKQDHSLRYEYESAFDEATYEQQVRLPGAVRHENRGTCLDLALLFASCLANAKIWPILVVVRGHAMTACWVTRPAAERETFLGLRELRDRIAAGEVVAVECTGFTEGFPGRPHKLGHGEACEEGRQLLRGLSPEQFCFALDVRRAWEREKVRPLPLSRDVAAHVRAGVPLQYPPLPAHYVRRPAEERRLEDDLLRRDGGPGVVVSAVFGLGGIGKSTLAAAVVQQSRRVRGRFADGVLWVTLGQSPELLPLLGQWIRDLGDHEFRAMDVRSASGRLRQLLEERAALLVVDDAWQSEHVEPFRAGAGPCCRLLVTTRKPRIAEKLHAISHELDVLSPEQAVELLATRLQRPLREDEHEPARRLAEAVGRLPLALELAAVRLGRQVTWEELLEKLKREVAALEALDDPAGEWEEKSSSEKQLEASLHLSLRELYEKAGKAFGCFVWLGVLPDDTTLAAPMASALWDFEDVEKADRLLEYLRGEALLQPAVAVRAGDKGWRAYRVHDLLHDCARRLLESPETPRRQTTAFGTLPLLPGLGLTRQEAHRGLVARYRKRTRGGLWHTLSADGYIHGRLGWHLEKAGDADGLHALLREERAEGRNGWYEANERLGQPAHFADCVAQAWRLADEAFAEGRPGALGLQCRYALVSASLNSLASNLPAGLLEALVRQGAEHGGWPVDQALAYARRKADAREKAEALGRLADFASSMERDAVLGEALAAARAVTDEAARSEALAALAPRLPEWLLGEAFALARSLAGEGDRFTALAALAPRLPAGERAAAWAEALGVARFMAGGQVARSTALAALLSPHLPESEYAAVLAEALGAVHLIGKRGSRARALAALVPHLPEGERAVALAEALRLARSISDERSRSSTLASLAAHLPAGLMSEALGLARSMADQSARSTALAALAVHLPGGERAAALAEALHAARSLADKGNRSVALAALAVHLPGGERAAALSEALHAARSIGDYDTRCVALAALAPCLPAGLAGEALRLARSIGNEWDRFRALAALSPHLAGGERAAALGEALTTARSIGKRGHRARALAALAPCLPEGERAAALAEALHAARSLGDRHAGSWLQRVASPQRLANLMGAIIDLACETAPEGACSTRPASPSPLLSAAINDADTLEDEWSRSRVLAALGAHLPARMMAEALSLARSMANPSARSTALAALAPYLPEGPRAAALAEALHAARSMHKGPRSVALTALLPRLPEGPRAAALADALHTERSIGEEGNRYWVLAALAAHLQGGERAAALAEALGLAPIPLRPAYVDACHEAGPEIMNLN